jgi:hypothetical protein
LDQTEKKVWQHQENYAISLTEKNLEELIGKNYLIEVSANINPGNYILVVEIGNNTGGDRVRKRANFTV